MPIERRGGGWFTPQLLVSIFALFVAGTGLVLGPAFGAFVAVVGTYVTSQTRSAVTETKLTSIDTKVDRLVEQMSKKEKDDARTEEKMASYGKDIADMKEDNKVKDLKIQKLNEWVEGQKAKGR